MALIVLIVGACFILLNVFWYDIFPNTPDGELQSEVEEKEFEEELHKEFKEEPKAKDKNIFLIVGIGVVVGFLLLVAFNLSFSYIMSFSPRYVNWMQVHNNTSQHIGTMINTIYVILFILALVGTTIIIIKAARNTSNKKNIK